MNKLFFVLVILIALLLQISPVSAQTTFKFDMQAAPAKLRFDGEYNLISVGTIFGGVLEFFLCLINKTNTK